MGAMTDNPTHPWETRPAGNPNGAWANSSVWGLAYKAVSLTVGKLYRISFTGSSLSGVGTIIGTGSDSSANNFTNKTTITAASSTKVFEATATTTHIIMQTASAAASGFTLAGFTLYEVTPGCVAADALACDGWGKDTDIDIWRQHNDGGTNTYDGSFYGLKVTTSTAAHAVYTPNTTIGPSDEWIQRFAGRTVTLGVWAKTSTANCARLRIHDASSTYSSYHTGGGGWEWLELTVSMSASATAAYFYIHGGGSATGTVYYSQPMLVFGSSIGEGNYTRPQGEIVWFEDYLQLTDYDGTTTVSSNTGAINIEAQSNGVIPKGVKAVNVSLVATSDGAAESIYTYDGSNTDLRGTWALTQIANGYVSSTGFQQCDANGDFGIGIDATFTGVRLRCTGVQLR